MWNVGGTIISISSSNKIILDIYGKNKRNIVMIYQNISELLSKYPTIKETHMNRLAVHTEP